MYTEEEIRKDQKRVMDLISALELKYGNSFSVVIAMGMDLNDEDDNEHQWAGLARCGGNGYLIHQCCHALLDNSARFVDEIIDTMKCILMHIHENEPEKLVEVREMCLELIKKDIIRNTSQFKEFKEKEGVEELVNGFLKDMGFKTEN
jgi:hypothetical protein